MKKIVYVIIWLCSILWNLTMQKSKLSQTKIFDFIIELYIKNFVLTSTFRISIDHFDRLMLSKVMGEKRFQFEHIDFTLKNWGFCTFFLITFVFFD